MSANVIVMGSRMAGLSGFGDTVSNADEAQYLQNMGASGEQANAAAASRSADGSYPPSAGPAAGGAAGAGGGLSITSFLPGIFGQGAKSEASFNAAAAGILNPKSNGSNTALWVVGGVLALGVVGFLVVKMK
jgi:hypothetical protein